MRIEKLHQATRMVNTTCNNCHQQKIPGQYVESDDGDVLCAFCFMTNYEWVVSYDEAVQNYDKVIVIDNAAYGRTTGENQFCR